MGNKSLGLTELFSDKQTHRLLPEMKEGGDNTFFGLSLISEHDYDHVRGHACAALLWLNYLQ